MTDLNERMLALLDQVNQRTAVAVAPAVVTAVAVATETESETTEIAIPPLTEYEPEPDEVKKYAIRRSVHWEKYFAKYGREFKITTPRQIDDAISLAVDLDVAAFKTNLYRIVGAEHKPVTDTVLVFKNPEDADEIRELGFDCVATVKKASTEGTNLQVAMTMLKMKYKRVILVGDMADDVLRMINDNIELGSMFIDEDLLKDLNQELNEVQDLKQVKKLLKDYIKSDEVQACSILRSADQVRDSVSTILSFGLEKIDEADPRAIIQLTMDGLRQIQVLDGKFPAPLTEKSLWGIIGDFVDIAYPTTNACKEMLVYQMLPVIGSALGDTLYGVFGSDRHYPVTYTLPIGKSSEGKGEAKHHVESAMRLVDPAWCKRFIHSNASSGEGLIRMLEDTRVKLNLTKEVRKNRFVIFNSEMVTTFNAAARKDSSLSGYLRQAYDFELLENNRSEKRTTVTADNYLMGFVGTTTPKELREVMPDIDWKNGSANRFLWCIGYKDKNKKLGRSSVRPNFVEWAKRVQKLLELNQNMDPTALQYSADGAAAWDEWEATLPEDNDDLLSDSQARIRANCLRIAVLYVVLDERRLTGWVPQIEERHVEAAIEIVTRSKQSVEWYLNLGNLTAGVTDPVVQGDVLKLKKAIVAASREGGTPELTQEAIARLFSHKTSEERDELCLQAGLRHYTRHSTGGRPTSVWTWQPVGMDPGPKLKPETEQDLG